MGTFDDFLALVLKNGKDLVETTLQGFQANAEADIQAYLAQERTILQNWTEEVAKGQMSQAEYADLLKGEVDVAKLASLTAAGVALADLERVRVGLIDVVVKAAFDTFWPV
jgi:hypothetical protein